MSKKKPCPVSPCTSTPSDLCKYVDMFKSVWAALEVLEQFILNDAPSLGASTAGCKDAITMVDELGEWIDTLENLTTLYWR